MKSKSKKTIALAVLLMFIGLPILVYRFGGDGGDFARSCSAKCSPRSARVVPNPAYPAPATGKPVPLVCQCY